MRIAVARETDSAEDRVAATPETVRKMKSLGAEVVVEPGGGVKSGFPDTEYTAAGGTIVKDAAKDAEVVLKVRRPGAPEGGLGKPGARVLAVRDRCGTER